MKYHVSYFFIIYSRPPIRTARNGDEVLSTTAFNKRQSQAYKGLRKYSQLTELSHDRRYTGILFCLIGKKGRIANVAPTSIRTWGSPGASLMVEAHLQKPARSTDTPVSPDVQVDNPSELLQGTCTYVTIS